MNPARNRRHSALNQLTSFDSSVHEYPQRGQRDNSHPRASGQREHVWVVSWHAAAW